MKRKRGFIIAALVIILIVLANAFLIKSNFFSFTGFAIGEGTSFETTMDLSKIMFVVQWIVILLIVYFAYLRHLKKAKTEKIEISYDDLKGKVGRGGTDIDLLYQLLKDGKKFRASVVMKIFSISRDQALEWMRILEDHDLARINYPAFAEPEIELYIKDEEDKKETKKEDKEKAKTKEETKEDKKRKKDTEEYKERKK
ncbi:MAG: hypothetical protein ABIE22_02710 [archaeon]